MRETQHTTTRKEYYGHRPMTIAWHLENALGQWVEFGDNLAAGQHVACALNLAESPHRQTALRSLHDLLMVELQDGVRMADEIRTAFIRAGLSHDAAYRAVKRGLAA